MKISHTMIATLQALHGYKTTANGYSTNPHFFRLHIGSVQALIKRGLLEEDGSVYTPSYLPPGDESNTPKRAALYRISDAGQKVLQESNS
jgi:hypothetical protein